MALNILGLIFVAVSIIAGIIVKSVPTGYAPKGWIPKENIITEAITNDLKWMQMIKTTRFYMLLAMFSIGTLSGLMIVSNLSNIGQVMYGLTATVAAFYIGIYSLSNCLGRIIWGSISDKIGRYYALIMIYIVISVMLLILINTRQPLIFLFSIVGIGLCFGGTMGVMPPIVTENFGAKYYGVNYGIVFVGYALAAFLGPKIAVNIAAGHGGDFTTAFYMALGAGLFGLLVTIIYIMKYHHSSISLKIHHG